VRHDDPVKRGQTGIIHTHPFGDLYHGLLTASWPRLVLIVAACYVMGNSLFALGYLLDPGGIDHARAGSFRDAFFFSIQTMATIGYGQMVPHSLFANILVTLEALVGVVGFALMTGLVFAKFSRPSARVLFSRVAVITQWDGIPSLLFRMANARGDQIVEAQIHLVLAREEITPEASPGSLGRCAFACAEQRTAFDATVVSGFAEIEVPLSGFAVVPKEFGL
jgi:inward rectifier potassium channel